MSFAQIVLAETEKVQYLCWFTDLQCIFVFEMLLKLSLRLALSDLFMLHNWSSILICSDFKVVKLFWNVIMSVIVLLLFSFSNLLLSFNWPIIWIFSDTEAEKVIQTFILSVHASSLTTECTKTTAFSVISVIDLLTAALTETFDERVNWMSLFMIWFHRILSVRNISPVLNSFIMLKSLFTLKAFFVL